MMLSAMKPKTSSRLAEFKKVRIRNDCAWQIQALTEAVSIICLGLRYDAVLSLVSFLLFGFSPLAVGG